jgi:hypothetical protein
VSAQDAADGQTTSSSAAGSPKALAQVLPTVPNVLQTMAGEAGDPTLSDIFNVTASGTYVASGVLFILGPLFTGPVNAVLPPTRKQLTALAMERDVLMRPLALWVRGRMRSNGLGRGVHDQHVDLGST